MKRLRLYSILMSIISICLLIMSGFMLAKADCEFSVNAKSAILADFNTGKIVYSLKKDEKYQIASMVKIMTLKIIFDNIKQGKISYDDSVIASDNACNMGGSQAFLDRNAQYKASELIKSIIVASANDSCVAMAEHIAGDVQSFVALMNKEAKDLNMNNTYYVNCTGLPAPNQYSTANDVLIVFRKLIENQDFYKFSNVWMYDFVHPSGRKTTLTNTNKLIKFYKGCDGGKTGFTNEAKSCLAATAKRDNTRLIAIVLGGENSKQRNKEISRLFNYGFYNYENKNIISRKNFNEKVKNVNIKDANINVYINEDYSEFIAKNDNAKFETKIVYKDIKAPINKGDEVGQIVILKNSAIVKTIKIYSDSEVCAKNLRDFIEELVKNW